MRRSLLPMPSEAELRDLPLREILRDFPELFPRIEALGLDPGPESGRALSDLLQARGSASVISSLLEDLAWRGPASQEPGTSQA